MRYDLNWESHWCEEDDFDMDGNWIGLPKKELQEIKLNFNTINHNLRKANTNILPSNTVVLDLSRSEEEIMMRMKPKTRYNIRLSQRYGVQVKEAGLESLGIWYDLYAMTALRNGLHLNDIEHFKNIFTSKMECSNRHPEGAEKSTLSYFSIIGTIIEDSGNRYRTMIVANLTRSLLLNIYDKVQRYSKDSTETVFSRREEIYKSFIELILKNFHEHRDVGFYASSLCITPRYLASVTSAVRSTSPKEIIDRLHFPDSSYLGRFFRHYMKTSPSAWRTREMSL